MTDRLTQQQRSVNMAAIKSKDTAPEMHVRRFLHGKGYRYRLHVKDLPGKPDIVLKKWRALVFVNGCYWHRHSGCRMAYSPRSNTAFWERKFADNVKRDRRNHRLLKAAGWKVIIVWGCEVKNGTFAQWLEQHIKTPLPHPDTVGDSVESGETRLHQPADGVSV